MTDNLCWNCGQSGHRSQRCPEPQKMSRCPSCNKVNAHDADCQNITFKSQSLFLTTTVFEIQKLLKVEFKNVTNVLSVRDVGRQVEIGNVPLWLSTIDAFVGKFSGNSLEFATSRPKKRHITFVNKNGEAFLSLVCYQKRATINNRFQLDENGLISFNCNARNEITETVVCTIAINNTSDVFKVRITWFGHKHIFEIHPLVGPILVDPQQPSEQRRGANDQNMSNVRLNAVLERPHHQVDVANEGAVALP